MHIGQCAAGSYTIKGALLLLTMEGRFCQGRGGWIPHDHVMVYKSGSVHDDFSCRTPITVRILVQCPEQVY